MSERHFTHYKYPLSRTQPIPHNGIVQDYYRNRGRVPEWEAPMPHNYMEVSLSAYKHNLGAIQRLTRNEQPDIIPIGKYGYMGNGGPIVSQLLINEGAKQIGFASSEELRFTHKEFPQIPSLMMYPLQTLDDLTHAIKHNAELTVQSLDELRMASLAARSTGHVAVIHLQAETGFHHYGGSLEELSAMFTFADQNNDALLIRGISSHFATAGDNNENARRQFDSFLHMLSSLHDRGHSVASVHIANSAAITQLPETWNRQTYSGVMPGAIPAIRPGGLIYGMYGDPNNQLNVQDAVTAVVSHIASTQNVNGGDSVGYCETFTAKEKTPIAIIPVGWGSGYMMEKTEQETNDEQHTQILIRGKRSPIVGLVGASSFAVKNIGEGERGEAVLLVGQEGKEKVTFDEIAEKNGMISTQVTTMLGKSLPQVYYEEQ